MKTHEFARALIQLAKILNAAPNMDLSELGDIVNGSNKAPTNENIAVNLATLAELSRVPKSQWLEIIQAYDFPIEVRPRDASGNVIYKLVHYLSQNEAAREKIKIGGGKKQAEASPELMRALQSLLKD